jgi:hypothetical protein
LKTFTVEVDDHGQQYKQEHIQELKGKFADFSKILKKLGPLILHKKQFDKSGKLDNIAILA